MRPSRASLWCILLLASTTLVPCSEGAEDKHAAASALRSDGVVLVAGNIIDLKWDPSNYPQENFVRWELYRGLSTTSMARIESGTDRQTDWYRDEHLADETTYHYRLDAVRCPGECPPSNEVVTTVWRSAGVTGPFQGDVHRDLTLDVGDYETHSVTVKDGARLIIAGDTTFTGAALAPEIRSSSSHLQIDGATFDGVSVGFYGGSGHLRGAHLVKNETHGAPAIWIAGDTTIEVSGNTFPAEWRAGSHIFVSGQAHARVLNNQTGLFSVTVSDQASADINSSSLYYLGVSSAGASAKATDTAFTYGCDVWDGSAEVVGGSVGGSAENPDVKGELRVGGVGRLTLKRIKVTNANVMLEYDSTVSITGNVFSDSYMAIFDQVAGTIQGNTIQNGRGIWVWGGKNHPELTFTGNCIRGNQDGLVQKAPREKNLNVKNNWWGHESGPKHATKNPGGQGDEIIGDQIDFHPWSPTGAVCGDTPPPPGGASSVSLTASPEEVIPFDLDYLQVVPTSEISVEVSDDEGKEVGGVKVEFTRSPELGSFQVSGGASDTGECTTGSDGRCSVTYQAPTVLEVFGLAPTASALREGRRFPGEVRRATEGEEEVTVNATVAGLLKTVTVAFTYLKPDPVHPQDGWRNVPEKDLEIGAYFDRDLDLSSVTKTTFDIRTDRHPGVMECNYLSAVDQTKCSVVWLSEDHPDDSIGLHITSKLQGGPLGIRGTDGTCLRKDHTWSFYTIPKLDPKIYPVQVSNQSPLVLGKDTIVRVHAGLPWNSELDWIEPLVLVTYNDSEEPITMTHRFFRGELGAVGDPKDARLKGNSANFSIPKGTAPLDDQTGSGHLKIKASLFPTPPFPANVPTFDAETSVEVVELPSLWKKMAVRLQPIAPHDYLFMEPSYEDRGDTPWAPATKLGSLGATALYREALRVFERLLPVTPSSYETRTTVIAVDAPPFTPQFKVGRRFLAQWTRLLLSDVLVSQSRDDLFFFAVVPDLWMSQVNGGDPIWHRASSGEVFGLMGADASPAAPLHCLGHWIVSGDDNWGSLSSPRLWGYDVAGDRIVDNRRLYELGWDYSVPLMTKGLWRSPANRVWVDVNNYRSFVRRFSTVLAPSKSAALSLAGSTVTVGGEVVQESGGESGRIDVLHLPARGNPFEAPAGSGDYSLRLLDATGGTLATHVFAAELEEIEPGVDYASFLLTVAAPEGLQAVELLHGTTVLASRQASANPPVVSITQPTAGAHSGEISVGWSATDPDAGDTVRSSAFYSQDDGESWDPLTLGTTDEQVTLSSQEYASCASCRIKVIADDGFHTTEVLSEAFSVSNPPIVSWVLPPADDVHAASNGEVIAGFRDAMDGTTIDATTFTLVDSRGSPVAATVSYEEEVQQAILTPAVALQAEATYTATVAGTVRDAGGVTLGADHSWSFTVASDDLALRIRHRLQSQP